MRNATLITLGTLALLSWLLVVSLLVRGAPATHYDGIYNASLVNNGNLAKALGTGHFIDFQGNFH